MTEHVDDDLELYAVGALRPGEADRVAAHLAGCPVCREALAEISTVVNALPDMVPLREPPAGLKERILSAATADAAAGRPASPARGSRWAVQPTAAWLGVGALAAGVVLLVALDLNSLRELQSAAAERAQVARTSERIAYGGRNWYMVGLDQWKGSGGTLFAPTKTDFSPFVVFHDLRPLSSGAVYAIWLVDADGHWSRGANFRPDGRAVQSVDLTIPVDTFAQCAVTIEMSTEGKRSGPVVMQSRIAAPAQ
jgi:hypothetical protein